LLFNYFGFGFVSVLLILKACMVIGEDGRFRHADAAL